MASPLYTVDAADISLSLQGRERLLVDCKAAGRERTDEATLERKNITAKAFQLLYQIAAEIEARDSEQLATFHRSQAKIALGRAQREFRKHLQTHQGKIDLNARISSDFATRYGNLLHIAISQRLEEETELLLKAGAPVNSLNLYDSALGQAIKYHPPLVPLLLKHGASINPIDPTPEEETRWDIPIASAPLTVATEKKNTQLIATLIEAGADPNLSGFPMYHTPLRETLRHCDLETTRTLIAYGADPNFANDCIIAEAARFASPAYTELLLDSGADLACRTLRANKSAIAQVAEQIEELQEFPRDKDDEKDLAALNKVCQRYRQALDCWHTLQQSITAAAQPETVLRTITPQQMILCSNAGRLNDVLSFSGWGQAKEHLHELLTQLPPWFTDRTQAQRPDLMTHNAPAQSWSDRLEKEPPSVGRGART